MPPTDTYITGSLPGVASTVIKSQVRPSALLQHKYLIPTGKLLIMDYIQYNQ